MSRDNVPRATALNYKTELSDSETINCLTEFETDDSLNIGSNLFNKTRKRSTMKPLSDPRDWARGSKGTSAQNGPQDPFESDSQHQFQHCSNLSKPEAFNDLINKQNVQGLTGILY